MALKKRNRPILTLLLAMVILQTGCVPASVSREEKGASTLVEELVKTGQSWDGQLLPAYPAGQPEITILRITIPPGTQLDSHHHPVINAGVLLKGQLTVLTNDGKRLDLKAGDPIVEVVDTWHYGINPGQAPAEIIVFYAGVVDSPITVIEHP